MADLPEVIEQLSSRVDALEKRVSRLEHEPGVAGAEAGGAAADAAPLFRPAQPSSTGFTGAFPVIGIAMLGVAGAYVLRALTGSALLPRRLLATIAILYALAWLLAAARSAARNRFAGGLYAGASALILAPMLWELCLKFHVLSPLLAATVLAFYAAAATAIAFHNHRSPAFSVGYAGAALTAVALSIGTHAMAPFIAILLAMLLICEAAELFNRPLPIRPLIALAADFAVWAMLFIYRTPPSTRADYPALGTAALFAFGLLPFFLSAPGVAWRALHRDRTMSAFDIAQSVLSFLLLAMSILSLMPSSGAIVLGILCLIFAVGCYAAAFGPLRRAAHPRNFNVFATWSAALLLTAVFLPLQPPAAAVALAAAALGAVLVGDRLQCRIAELHGMLYFVVAGIASGLFIYVFQSLLGHMPAAPTWPVAILAAAIVVACAAGDERPGEEWRRQFLHLIPALLAAFSAAALMARGLVALASRLVALELFHIAFLRTLTLCCVSLALAFAASHWHKLELKRVAYIALALVAAKLFFEDLRYGRMEFIAASIFLVALTLIAVPRLAQRSSAG